MDSRLGSCENTESILISFYPYIYKLIQLNPVESSLFFVHLSTLSRIPPPQTLTDSEKGISFSSRYKGVVNEFKLVITASRRKCTQ